MQHRLSLVRPIASSYLSRFGNSTVLPGLPQITAKLVGRTNKVKRASSETIEILTSRWHGHSFLDLARTRRLVALFADFD